MGEYADQRAHDVAWMTAAERERLSHTAYGYTQAEHCAMVDAVVASGVCVQGWTWPEIIAEYDALMMAARS